VSQRPPQRASTAGPRIEATGTDLTATGRLFDDLILVDRLLFFFLVTVRIKLYSLKYILNYNISIIVKI
jgi:hypothetical protein